MEMGTQVVSIPEDNNVTFKDACESGTRSRQVKIRN